MPTIPVEPNLPGEPDSNEPIPTPSDDTGAVSGDEPKPEGDDEKPVDPPGKLDDGPLVA